jgi:regulatory protein
MMERKYEKSEIYPRALKWCDRKERTEKQLTEKLSSWGIDQDEIDAVLIRLKQAEALNERRFAFAYSRDYLKFKKWGRLKIKMGLQNAGVPSHLIHEALNDLDAVEYLEILNQVIQAAMNQGHSIETYPEKMKLASYLARKGFESSIIFNALDDLNQG